MKIENRTNFSNYKFLFNSHIFHHKDNILILIYEIHIIKAINY